MEEDESMNEASEMLEKDSTENRKKEPEGEEAIVLQMVGRKRVNKSLWQLAREGDLKEIEIQLESNGDFQNNNRINQLDSKNLSPLHYACKYLRLGTMKLLISHGANVDIKGEDNMTPLHFVCRYGSDQCGEVVEYLIDKGACVNCSDVYGLHPLHFCAIRGNLTACKILFNSPNITKKPLDLQNCTPLHLAATYGQVEVAKKLLEEDSSSLNHASNDTRLPIHNACQVGCFEIVELILNSTEDITDNGYQSLFKQIDLGDNSGETPLALAVNIGSTKIVEMLLANHNANPSIADSSHTYPIHNAAKSGNVEILKLLLEHMLKEDFKHCLSDQNETPLHIAASHDKVEAIELLCSQEIGADIDALTQSQETPLMYAVEEGAIEAARCLLGKNANMNLSNADGQSILHIAAYHNQYDVLKAIFDEFESEAEVLLNSLDIYENTALHISAREGHHGIVELLLKKFATSERSKFTEISRLISGLKNDSEETPLHCAVIKGRLDVVKQLLIFEKNLVYCIDENNNTALHLACLNRKPKIAEELLNFGACVKERNSKQWTPLDCASSVGAVECAKVLLDYDSPLDPLDRAKSTPLHLACENGHPEMVTLLLEHGADVSKEDHENRNPLERALLKEQRDCVQKILQHPQWKTAMRTSYPTKNHREDIIVETPMRSLIKKYPDLAELVFQKCITISDNNSSCYQLDYEFLEDSFYHNYSGNIENKVDDDNLKCDIVEDIENDVGCSRHFFKYAETDEQGDRVKFSEAYHDNPTTLMWNHPLMIIAKDERNLALLTHPLCKALLRKKWKNFGRYFYYGIFIGYVIFLSILSAYGIKFSKTYRATSEDKTEAEQNFQFCNQNEGIFDAYEIFIIVFSVVFLIFEIIQFIRHGIRYWSWSNLLDWVVYGLAIAIVVIDAIPKEQSPVKCMVQWQLLTILITVAWLNLLSYLRQFWNLGVYIIMFIEILKTFTQFAVIFVIFIIAFGFGFHFLLINQTSFEQVRYTMLKTSVMMIGEMEYTDIFHGDDEPYFPITTWIYYAIFLVAMPIIMMNLLVGLAVDDIQVIQEKATLKRLAMDVELVLDIQRLLPIRFLRMIFNQKEELCTKHKWWHNFKVLLLLNTKHEIVNTISKAASDSDLSAEEEIKSLRENVKQLSNEMKLLTEHTRENKLMLNALVKKFVEEDMDE